MVASGCAVVCLAPIGSPARLFGFSAQAQVSRRVSAGGKPSSAARAIDSGVDRIERVDRLVQMIGRGLGLQNQQLDEIVEIVDARLSTNANFKTVANVG